MSSSWVSEYKYCQGKSTFIRCYLFMGEMIKGKRNLP